MQFNTKKSVHIKEKNKKKTHQLQKKQINKYKHILPNILSIRHKLMNKR